MIDPTTELRLVAMALGWDPAEPETEPPRQRPRFDLNSAALLFAGDTLVEVVYHEQLVSADGAVQHTGDSPTGHGPGDNEVITIDLARLAAQVTAVIFVVTSYSGQPFIRIDNAYCRLLDAASGFEFIRYELSGGPHTALVVGKLTRMAGPWQCVGIGVGIYAQHPAEAIAQLGPYLP